MRRTIHYVFKIGDRRAAINFYTRLLGMQVLRHEEFSEGCKATCNGPYSGRWSKTMIGYGAEIEHFVIELVYNYGVPSCRSGNDYVSMAIHEAGGPQRLQAAGLNAAIVDGQVRVTDPDGRTFYVCDTPTRAQPASEATLAPGIRTSTVHSVTLHCTNIDATVAYYTTVCGMTVRERDTKSAVFAFADNQCALVMQQVEGHLDRAETFGRLACECPVAELSSIESMAHAHAVGKVQTPLVSLDTPGKAAVEVVILADPDGHEICFVGMEAFAQLAKVDPKAAALLQEAIADDKSNE